MREIKFRAWDDKKKEMIEMLPGDLGRPGFLMDFFVNVFEAQTPGEDNMKLMQFTGLLDKNGKEIYEGDIVKRSGGFYTVEWREGAFFARSIKYPDHAGFELGQVGRTAIGGLITPVIGNIYENPELLKGE